MHLIGISGSPRSASYNTLLLKTVSAMLPADVTLEIVSIASLPLYNQDLEKDFPKEVRDLQEKIRAADGVMIASPEFNRTISAPLKNALDWTSRPEHEPLVWAHKPVFVLGGSNGVRGASFSQYDVKRVMLYFDARVCPQPEVYVGEMQKKFNEEGVLVDERTKEVLHKAVETFIDFIQRV